MPDPGDFFALEIAVAPWGLVAWLDVALRARLPGVPGFCEGKVIEHQEQETYLVEWSYPNPLSGEPVTFRQSAGVREMRKWKKPPA